MDIMKLEHKLSLQMQLNRIDDLLLKAKKGISLANLMGDREEIRELLEYMDELEAIKEEVLTELEGLA